MRLRTNLLVFRAAVLLRRANRRRRRQLTAELASYSTEADLNDLYAMLNTYPDGQTHEVREILHQQWLYRTRTPGQAR